ncbi:IS6 family transposase [Natronolimnobius sp. AArcel1]|uniref:IS6 family transposase n=1 Tax=Natronolimnobius sp. AArcel1 TaxID=1679093 RepID=UPI0013EDE847|nr:IS6 family transposase [Natronolimnobius sp. AArcel1]NGM71268.1 IS6 family transposase [Natronolimnobius sp. AArcel1]
MKLADLLSESYAAEFDEAWEREQTATPVRVFAVRLHATGCSLRETQAILRLVGVERSHQAIWNGVYQLADIIPDPPVAKPSRVAVDETAVKINGEWSWLYAAIDLETKLIPDAQLFGRHGTGPAAAFLHRLREKHDFSETVFLVGQFGYRTAISRLGLNVQVDYTDKNLIEKWFHTFKIRVDRFHNLWVDSRRSARKWIEHFVHYYNCQKPHQSLDGRTPVEEVLN